MSKSDDNNDEFEGGMTTAERRRRKRRGAGLRVPSDNVPRRNSNPVVAPVPENPNLAVSIAYSFSGDTAERINAPADEAGDDFDVRTPPLGIAVRPGPDASLAERPASPSFEAMVTDPGFDPRATVPGTVFDPRTTMPGSKLDGSRGSDDDAPGGSGGHPSLLAAIAAVANDPIAPENVTTFVDAQDAVPAPVVDTSETREMAAVDLEALGLTADAAGTSGTMPRSVASPAQPSSRDELPSIIVDFDDASVAAAGRDRRDASGTRDATAPLIDSATLVPAVSQPIPQQLSGPQAEVPTAERRSVSAGWSQPNEALAPPPARASVPVAAPIGTSERASSPGAAAIASARFEASTSDETFESFTELRDVEGGDSGVRAGTVALSDSDIQPVDDVRRSGSTDGDEISVDIEESDSAEIAIESTPAPLVTGLVPALAPAAHEPAPTRSKPVSQPPVRASAPAVAPPPPPAAKAVPPAPPPAAKTEKRPPAVHDANAAKKAKLKNWFVDFFDEDYLRTLPFLTPQATQSEAEFVLASMELPAGAQLLDVGCGYGRHAMEMAARGYHVVGLDLSLPLLVRGGEEAHRRGLTINFVRGDMRELDFDNQFDGAYCLFSTFGYFDDDANKQTVANIGRALRPGGKLVLEVLNRDYLISDLPTRVWWEGEGCVVLEEVDFNYFASRVHVNRSVVFDDGRQVEQEFSLRAYALHEIGRVLHGAGFRVLEVSGGYQVRGRFFGNQSRHLVVVAEKRS